MLIHVKFMYVIPLPYGAYKPPFVKKIDNSMLINLDLTQEHLATSSQGQISPSPSTLFAPGQPGVRTKRNKRLNRIAKASPALVVRSDDYVPDLVDASSDDDSAP